LENVWSRPYHKLPIHIDIPRLSKKIRVYSGEKCLHGNPDGELEGEEIIYFLLLTLAKELEDFDACNFIEKHFRTIVDEYAEPGNDTSGELSRFLKAMVTEVGSEGKMLRVLKAVHQKVIFSGFYLLQSKLCPTLGRFKDSIGSWHINIFIYPTNIRVVHTKAQISSPLEDITRVDYEFKWQLEIHLNPLATKIIGSNVNIIDVIIPSTVTRKRKRIIEQTFDKAKQSSK